jgi:hypothetical protein
MLPSAFLILHSPFSILNLIWSGFPLQVLARSARSGLSASIPRAGVAPRRPRMRPELNHPCIARFSVLLQPENTYIPRRQNRRPPGVSPPTADFGENLPAPPRRLSPKFPACAQLRADFLQNFRPARNSAQTFAKISGFRGTPRRLSPKFPASAELRADFRQNFRPPRNSAQTFAKIAGLPADVCFWGRRDEGGGGRGGTRGRRRKALRLYGEGGESYCFCIIWRGAAYFNSGFPAFGFLLLGLFYREAREGLAADSPTRLN